MPGQRDSSEDAARVGKPAPFEEQVQEAVNRVYLGVVRRLYPDLSDEEVRQMVAEHPSIYRIRREAARVVSRLVEEERAAAVFTEGERWTRYMDGVVPGGPPPPEGPEGDFHAETVTGLVLEEVRSAVSSVQRRRRDEQRAGEKMAAGLEPGERRPRLYRPDRSVLKVRQEKQSDGSYAIQIWRERAQDA